jgi:drug/metabolite transporter (DMT)-like permease
MTGWRRAEHPVAVALASAILFGLSAPAAKALLSVADPWLLAGLLYVGSGSTLALLLAARGAGRRAREASLRRADWPWLAAAVVLGGGVGPVLLMIGLGGATAAEAALLLNLEGVLTAGVAWLVFGEHYGARVATGLVAISLGALVLSWTPGHGLRLTWATMPIASACLAWAIDNNVTRHIAARDPVQIAALKGLAAGSANMALALALGASMPGPVTVAGAALVGVLGYGVSLVLFIGALRHLGAARASAYFATAPFVGAAASVLALGEPLTPPLLVAGLLMAVGTWLHASEAHTHEHEHEPLEHEHQHRHDEHHQHEHGPDAPGGEPHSHWHRHGALRHRHRHFPDLHHRHPH